MTDQSPGFVETLLTDTEAIAARFSAALADAAMASIDRAASHRCRSLDQPSLRAAIHGGIEGYLAGSIAEWRARNSPLTWRYDRARRRLLVTGNALELSILKSRIASGPITAKELDAIVYTTVTHTLILRGCHLRKWLAGATPR